MVDFGCLSKERLSNETFKGEIHRRNGTHSLWGRFKPNKDWVDEFEMFTICMLPRLDPDDEDAGSMAEE